MRQLQVNIWVIVALVVVNRVAITDATPIVTEILVVIMIAMSATDTIEIATTETGMIEIGMTEIGMTGTDMTEKRNATAIYMAEIAVIGRSAKVRLLRVEIVLRGRVAAIVEALLEGLVVVLVVEETTIAAILLFRQTVIADGEAKEDIEIYSK